MEPAELRRLLNEGIQAVKTGDGATARDRLLRVLDADDRSEPAWLWLSAALDDPADQLLALERVLEINPGHPQALPVLPPQPAGPRPLARGRLFVCGPGNDGTPIATGPGAGPGRLPDHRLSAIGQYPAVLFAVDQPVARPGCRAGAGLGGGGAHA